jgi:hypothetical protein
MDDFAIGTPEVSDLIGVFEPDVGVLAAELNAFEQIRERHVLEIAGQDKVILFQTMRGERLCDAILDGSTRGPAVSTHPLGELRRGDPCALARLLGRELSNEHAAYQLDSLTITRFFG